MVILNLTPFWNKMLGAESFFLDKKRYKPFIQPTLGARPDSDDTHKCGKTNLACFCLIHVFP